MTLRFSSVYVCAQDAPYTLLTRKIRCRYDDGSYDVDFLENSGVLDLKPWHKVALREDQIREIAVEGVDAEGSGALKDDKVTEGSAVVLLGQPCAMRCLRVESPNPNFPHATHRLLHRPDETMSTRPASRRGLSSSSFRQEPRRRCASGFTRVGAPARASL